MKWGGKKLPVWLSKLADLSKLDHPSLSYPNLKGQIIAEKSLFGTSKNKWKKVKHNLNFTYYSFAVNNIRHMVPKKTYKKRCFNKYIFLIKLSELQKTKSAINKGIKSSYLKLICTSNSKKMKRKETIHLFISSRGTTHFLLHDRVLQTWINWKKKATCRNLCMFVNLTLNFINVNHLVITIAILTFLPDRKLLGIF